jgi:ubiquinone/menaquinone biosynthesis C-methylase UbiE
MERQLERIRIAYDLTVEQYERGIDPLDGVPDHLKNAPEFQNFVAEASESCHVGSPDVRSYLDPKPGMAFLDVGCAADLKTHRLYEWESTYHGVDVSPGLIRAMKRFVADKDIQVGALHVADAAALPFEDGYFDIAAIIGVLEYCTPDYADIALDELCRVLRPHSRVVLDIPNMSHPHVDLMFSLEESLGRPQYEYNQVEFEKALARRFEIKAANTSLVMLKYYCQMEVPNH